MAFLDSIRHFFGLGVQASSEGGLARLLEVDSIAMLSAVCCNPRAAHMDQELRRNLEHALAELRLDVPIYVETITAAQAQLRSVTPCLEPEQQRLIASVLTLFQSHGLGVFPILIVNRKVAFYGGVPTPDMLLRRLPALLSRDCARRPHAPQTA